MRPGSTAVLIVGAGPTGLTLAALLRTFGTEVRIIDRQDDRVHESRALAIQPRSLEVVAGLGLADTLVERGRPAVWLHVHARGRTHELPLFDLGLDDTVYPFLLFLSQAETEAVLLQHLADHGVVVERGVELVGLRQDRASVVCTVLHRDGTQAEIEAEHVVGCDGARSSVRRHAGIEFTGGRYPQTFVLADLEADGLDAEGVHVYLSGAGMLFFFPLGHPAPWRLLGMVPRTGSEEPAGDAPTLDELQAVADRSTAASIRLREPVWATYFPLHHRHAARYRSGRVFLAGDAAHIHSPAGAQGMNTGIQDAANLAWKLALVTRGTAHLGLLDTYEIERQPVGRAVLRFTDRAFTIATSASPVLRFGRTHIAPSLLRLALGSRRGRALAFRSVSQLAISYRASPLSGEGESRRRRGRGPRAGDRLPDAPVTVDSRPTTLHRLLVSPGFQLLLAGPVTDGLDNRIVARLGVHRLARQPAPGLLVDIDGTAHRRLGIVEEEGAQVLVRPDGHIAYRAAGADLAGLVRHLDRWLQAVAP